MPRKNSQTKHLRFTRTVINCNEKRKYPTEKMAQSAADYQMLINYQLELSVYKCEFCKKWHLTKNTNDEILNKH